MAYSMRRRRRYMFRRFRRRRMRRYRRRSRKRQRNRGSYANSYRVGTFRSKSIHYPRSVVPATWYRRLRYVSTVTLGNVTPLVLSLYVFRANSLYDPDYTGTGHQPYGVDQLDPFYSRATVMSSSVRVVFQNNSGNSAICGVIPSQYNGLSNDVTTTFENQTYVGLPITPGWSRCVKSRVSLRHLYSVGDVMDTPERFSVNVPIANNPNVVVYYHLFAYTASVAGIPADAIGALVEITYNVMYDLPVNLAQS